MTRPYLPETIAVTVILTGVAAYAVHSLGVPVIGALALFVPAFGVVSAITAVRLYRHIRRHAMEGIDQ